MNKLTQALRYVAPLIAVVAWAGMVHAQSVISVNFSYNGNVDTATSHAPILATDVVGAVPVANWNDAATEGGAPLSGLIDNSGAATSAIADWATANSWGGNADPAPSDPTERMMTTWLDNGGPLKVSNIPYAAYDVYIYGSSDGTGNAGRSLGWNVNGVDHVSLGTLENVSINGDFYNGTLVDGSTAADDPSYLKISGLVGDLMIADHTNANAITRSGVSGIQIVEVNFEATLRLVVNRGTGNISLTNNTGSAVDLAGLSILSDSGSLKPANWQSITDNYDEGGSVSSDEWLKVASNASELGEATLGTGTLAQGQTIDLGNAWQKSVIEDIATEILDANSGATISSSVVYSGDAFVPGDYDFDGDIDRDDWPTQRDNYAADLSGVTATAAYLQGDFDLDGDNDINDLKAFKAAFLAAGNSLSELSGSPVPEPSSLIMVSIVGVILGGCRRMRIHTNALTLLSCVTLLFLVGARPADAASIGVSYAGDNSGGTSIQISPTQVAGVIPQANWNAATGENDTLGNLVDNTGAVTGASVTWTSPNTWGGSSAPTDDAAMVNGWLDDGGGVGNSSVITGIPYSQYDVYVYGSSDTGNGGRGWNVDINGTNFASNPGVWEDPDTENSFFDNTNYVDASTGANNPTYFVARGLFGDLTITGLRQTVDGLDSRGSVSGFQIVEATGAPVVLTLEINTVTGSGKVKNDTESAVDFDFYEILSDPSASLDSAGWISIQDGGQNGFPQGDSSGNGWEELGGIGDNRLAEYYLDGVSTLGVGESFSLGKIFDTASGVQDDISFRYNDANTTTRIGLIEFVTDPGSIPGDFDGNGSVGNSDLTLLLDSWGKVPAAGWVNDVPAGTVGNASLTILLDNWGNSALAGINAVPEPSTGLMMVLGGVFASVYSRRRRGGRTVEISVRKSNGSSVAVAAMLVAICLMTSSAFAAVTLDRDYSFGEDTLENPSANAAIGSNNTAPLAANTTADSSGPSGAFLDLSQTGDPVYANVGPSGLARPGAGSGEFGVRFNGTDNYLTGTPLNRPEELAGPTAVGNGPLVANYPLNYDNLPGHGMQLWVYPSAASLGSEGAPTTYQSIVFDTVLTGGPAINAAGQWTQSNSGHTDAGPIPATVSVAAGDTWYHVMHHNIHRGGDNFLSIVYVDGVAVSGNADTIPVGGTGDHIDQLVVGAAEAPGDGTVAVYNNYFDGVVDDLEMYVYGNNTSSGGQDYGTFDLFADNEWIANEIVNTVPGGVLDGGDIDKDGDVDNDDVTSFVANWRYENLLPGAHGDSAVGDWNTWNNGDFNHDGRTNYSDWFILRANHPSPLSLDLEALLAAVPEPSSAALLLLGVVGSGMLSRRRIA